MKLNVHSVKEYKQRFHPNEDEDTGKLTLYPTETAAMIEANKMLTDDSRAHNHIWTKVLDYDEVILVNGLSFENVKGYMVCSTPWGMAGDKSPMIEVILDKQNR
jgi:hypothetical protein